MGLSKALGILNDHEGAIANLKQALQQIKISQNKMSHQKIKNQVWYNLGVAYAKLNQVKQALDYWRKVEQNSAEYEDTLKFIQYFTR